MTTSYIKSDAYMWTILVEDRYKQRSTISFPSLYEEKEEWGIQQELKLLADIEVIKVKSVKPLFYFDSGL